MIVDTLQTALTFFLVSNPIGNSPTVLSLLKDYSFEKQQRIILREALISFLIALFFNFFGRIFLNALHISEHALALTGGLILFTIALQMMFHKPETEQLKALKQEPFIVPIATPLVSGAGLMTMIMISSEASPNTWDVTLAVIIAFTGVTLVLVSAPYVQRLIGRRGMEAMEQVMGMILALISMQMLVDGSLKFARATFY